MECKSNDVKAHGCLTSSGAISYIEQNPSPVNEKRRRMHVGLCSLLPVTIFPSAIY